MPGIIIRLGRPRPPTQMNRHREKTKGAWRIPSSLEFDRGYTRAYRPTRGSGWARLTGWPKTPVRSEEISVSRSSDRTRIEVSSLWTTSAWAACRLSSSRAGWSGTAFAARISHCVAAGSGIPKLASNGDRTFPVPKEAYYMAGAGGQTTLIIPSHDLVVVRLGHYKGAAAGGTSLRKSLALLTEAVPARR